MCSRPLGTRRAARCNAAGREPTANVSICDLQPEPSGPSVASMTAHRILVIGGHGHVAKHFTQLTASQGRQVDSIIRRNDQAHDVTSWGGNPVVADVTTLRPSQWDDLISNHDAVVWSAGAGGKGARTLSTATRVPPSLTLSDGPLTVRVLCLCPGAAARTTVCPPTTLSSPTPTPKQPLTVTPWTHRFGGPSLGR